LWASIYCWVYLGKVPSSVFKPFFEARSMIPRHSMLVRRPLQGVRRHPPPLLQLGVFSPTVRTQECGVQAPVSVPSSPARVGSSSPPVCGRWIPGDLMVHLMAGEGSSGEGAWYTHAVTSNSQCSLPVSVVLVCVFDFLIYVLLLTPATCYGRS
jgi:hypothetical protein